jgi:hypothetical protein
MGVDTMKKVLLGVIIALVLLVGGCFAVLGAGINAADEAISAEAENDKPRAVAVGKAFEHDDYKVAAGWKVVKDALGSADITGLKVTNTHDGTEVVQFTFTFVKGNDELGEVECNAGELEAGQSAAMDCFSLDEGFPKGYTEVRVADMW